MRAVGRALPASASYPVVFIQCGTQLQGDRRISARHQLLSIVRCTVHMGPAISGEHPLHCRATLHVQLSVHSCGVAFVYPQLTLKLKDPGFINGAVLCCPVLLCPIGSHVGSRDPTGDPIGVGSPVGSPCRVGPCAVLCCSVLLCAVLCCCVLSGPMLGPGTRQGTR